MSFPQGPLAIRPLELPANPKPYIWAIPGSKSITNRALVLAALAEGTTILRGVLHSDDTRHCRNALSDLGIAIETIDETTLRVEGGVSRLRAPEKELFIGNSGTTVRFLTALAALVPGKVTLVGDEHMAKRPISDLVEGLKQLGVKVDCPSGCPPITIYGGELSGGRVKMRGDKSSQYFSALLMAGPAAKGRIELDVVGSLVSRPYVEITLDMMRRFGAVADSTDTGFVTDPGGYLGIDYHIEPDASSASYALAAAAATGLDITVPGIGLSALQGDAAFADVLERAGATVERREHDTRVIGGGTLRGHTEDMHHISDTVMTLAAIAPTFEGKTRIENVANIRIKETDRLLATVNELRRLGQKVEHGDDWLEITPAPITPAVVRSYSDHRMAMSFAILGLVRPGISIEDPACVAKTYPTFWDDLKKLYAHVGQDPGY
ncbi:MAG: 3-phosphoshikimate 1-carboxyvinyltransferase [Sorangiineae bacterium NIC37A_2]|jgi:3-phosphoshikimate 1-carboxyvinyltransferase|nr:MAG: 3-phosphoshikimate 1-carboxyvinyltransferase [Sorangiineae bacterium NIC37A_2]